MDKKKALIKAQNLCALSEKCTFDIEQKLKKWKLNYIDIEDILDQLQASNFIDNSRYAELYTREKLQINKWGRIKITYNLRMKKIDQSLIEKAFDQINEDEYDLILRKEIEKKFNSIKDKDHKKLKNNLLRFGLSRGFENGKVFECVNSTLKDFSQ